MCKFEHLIISEAEEDKSLKYLTYRFPTVEYRPTVTMTGNGSFQDRRKR